MRAWMIALRPISAASAGTTAIEYSLIACFVAIALIVGAAMTGNGLNQLFWIVGSQMNDASNEAEGG